MELSSLLRYCSFLIYNLSVYLFVYYLNIYHSWEIYKDWWLNDIKGNENYDYIVGELKLEFKYFLFKTRSSSFI